MRSININLDEIVIDFEKNHERYYNEIISNTSITKKEKKIELPHWPQHVELKSKQQEMCTKRYIYIQTSF